MFGILALVIAILGSAFGCTSQQVEQFTSMVSTAQAVEPTTTGLDLELYSSEMSPLSINADVIVYAPAGLNFRTEPSADAPQVVSNVKLQTRDLAKVIGGPIVSGDYTWWQITVFTGQLSGQTGWAVDKVGDFRTLVLLTEFEPGYDPAKVLAIGGTAHVFVTDVDGLYLMSEPGAGSELTLMPTGRHVNIIGGPQTAANGLVYWQVLFQDKEVLRQGWAAAEAEGIHTLIAD